MPTLGVVVVVVDATPAVAYVDVFVAFVCIVFLCVAAAAVSIIVV